jgi:hypothetical protein
MIINTSKPKEVIKANEHFKKLIDSECRFELKKLLNTRTTNQNRALHLFFKFVSVELNELGLEFTYNGLTTKGLSSIYTELIVKEFIWKPIQVSMFGFESTTKLTTKDMNDIIDVIVSYFGEKGIDLQFPNIEKLID